MAQVFKQFVQPPIKTHAQRLEENILMAFGKGASAAKRLRQGKKRTLNPFDHRTQEELFQAWVLGWQEQMKGPPWPTARR